MLITGSLDKSQNYHTMVLISVCRLIKPRTLSSLRHLQKLNSSTHPAPGSPVATLLEKIEKGELLRDDYQVQIAGELQSVYQELQQYEPPKQSLFGKMFGGRSSKMESPKGIYLFGAVGGGKTMLMDLFYSCCQNIPLKQRVHFHAFMQDVHTRIHENKQKQLAAGDGGKSSKSRSYDPISPVAEAIGKEAWLICFDEFQVNTRFSQGFPKIKLQKANIF
jgi:peroxisome-assembly ATPase